MFSCRCEEATEESFSGYKVFRFYAPDQPGTFLCDARSRQREGVSFERSGITRQTWKGGTSENPEEVKRKKRQMLNGLDASNAV
jgi:hypothetical protein